MGNACGKKTAEVCETTQVAPTGTNVKDLLHHILSPYNMFTVCNNFLNLDNSPQQFYWLMCVE